MPGNALINNMYEVVNERKPRTDELIYSEILEA